LITGFRKIIGIKTRRGCRRDEIKELAKPVKDVMDKTLYMIFFMIFQPIFVETDLM